MNPVAEKKRAFEVSSEPVVGVKTDSGAHKYEATREEPPARVEQPIYEDLGALPESYGEPTLCLIARDPNWLFSYWDTDFASVSTGEMRGDERKFFLKILVRDEEEACLEIKPEARNWYVPVSRAETTYRGELGFFQKDGGWKALVTSGETTTPANALSERAEAEFATVPFHIAFQRLMEMVEGAMAGGASLIGALSRLQGQGRELLFRTGEAPAWTDEQRRVLTALVGEEVVERIGLGSDEIDRLLRQKLLEKLSTESASELAARGMLSGGESSLFSGLGLWGSETSSLSSGLGLWGSETSSLFSGIGASWSAQPFSAQAERGFFMHVNAEVIFYGGTHPDAKVTVDGRPIQLQPDGSFRYHFKFPDADFEIPIVAVSPDGVETRSATLSLRRATGRSGDVGATGQPAKLGEPMGRR